MDFLSLGLIIVVEFFKNCAPEIKPIFTKYNNTTIEIDTGIDRLLQLQQRSEPLKCLKTYPKYWRKVVKVRFLKRLVYWLNPLNWRKIRVATMCAGFIMLREMVFRLVRLNQE